MDAQSLIARRVALEPRSGDLVDLGIGIPTLVANYVTPDLKVFVCSRPTPTSSTPAKTPRPKTSRRTGRITSIAARDWAIIGQLF